MATSRLTAQSITAAEVAECLSLYTLVREHVYSRSPAASKGGETLLSKIARLDDFRYDSLPRVIQGRSGSREGFGAYGWLLPEELQELVEWKLTHGKNRPTLRALIRSNSNEAVQDVTKHALDRFDAFKSADPLSAPTILRQVLDRLCSLKGVGPATASLVMSVSCPRDIPFFADELFEWACGRPPKKYDRKEYEELAERVKEVGQRTGREASVVDLEKVAWVLIKAQRDQEVEKIVTEGLRDGANDEQSGAVTESFQDRFEEQVGIVESPDRTKLKGRKRKAQEDVKTDEKPTKNARKSVRVQK